MGLIARGLKLVKEVADALRDPRAHLLPAKVIHVFTTQAALIRDMADRIEKLERDMSELKGNPDGQRSGGDVRLPLV